MFVKTRVNCICISQLATCQEAEEIVFKTSKNNEHLPLKLWNFMTLWQKPYFQLKNHVLFHTQYLDTCCSSVKRSLEKLKRDIIRCSVRCFMFCIQTNPSLRNTISCIPSKDYQSARSRPTRKSVSQLARCSVAHTYFWSSFRILFTVFSETKTELWKLM